MTFLYNLSNFNLTVNHIKTNKLKHTYLRILDKQTLQIKSNRYFTHNDALKLLHKKRSWLEKTLNRLDQNKLLPNHFYYLGKSYHKNDFEIYDVNKFYKSEAKEIIMPIIDKYTHIMQLYPNKITFRNNKSRWGSCSSKNNISLNTQLVKLPKELIDYIVVHELAHIKHKHHQKEFYKEVEIYLPNYKQLDKELKSFSLTTTP